MKLEALVYERTCGNRKLGEEVHLTVDGTPFARLEADGEAYRTLVQEICETFNYDPTSNSRPPKAIRVDRGARFQAECRENLAHVTKTIETNMKSCQEKYDLLKQLLDRADTYPAVKWAAELNACRAFVTGVITGRLHKQSQTVITNVIRDWESQWDQAFGDLVGKTLNMQH